MGMSEEDQANLADARRWIEDWLLGDVRTFLKGVEVVQGPNPPVHPDGLFGRGNLSVPILLSTATEVLGALHEGKTNCGGRGGYDATRNAAAFIHAYWPTPYPEFAHLLWDGMRNGLAHTFSAKWFVADGARVDLQFAFEDETVIQWRGPDHAALVLSVYELYRVVRDAAKEYFDRLGSDAGRMWCFQKAFGEMAEYRRDLTECHNSQQKAGLDWIVAHATQGQEYALLAGTRRPERIAHIVRGESPVVCSTQNYGTVSIGLGGAGGGEEDGDE